uniref:hypothetical protein n=1 Tax=Caldalkalibacillus salinus TaxID=2803787 RepID=UPI001F4614A2
MPAPRNFNRDNLTQQCHHKMTLTEIKLKVLQVTYALLQDDIYTKQEAAQELIDVIQRLEVE